LSLFDFVQWSTAFEPILRISGGFRKIFKSRRRLPESWNKLPEKGYWKTINAHAYKKLYFDCYEPQRKYFFL
jgi:hypothetical protein